MQGEELPVWGVDSDALEHLIQFFYSGECRIISSSAVPVYDAAQRLEVPNLAAACEGFIREILGASTCCMLLKQAEQYKVTDLANQCLACIEKR